MTSEMKRVIKALLMMCAAVYKHDGRAKLFFYHDIGTTNTPMGTSGSVFWSHMRILQTYHARTPVRHMIAFDDGFRGVWECREQLKSFGVRPLVFVAVRLIGQPGYLTWEEMLTLQNEYGYDFQCHTWSHQTLAGEYIDESPIEDRTDAWYQRELVQSKEELERRLSKKITGLCFPAGMYSVPVITKCKAAGYTRLYASYPGNLPGDDELIVPRNLVQDLGPLSFKAALRGGLMAFEKRYRCAHYVKD